MSIRTKTQHITSHRAWARHTDLSNGLIRRPGDVGTRSLRPIQRRGEKELPAWRAASLYVGALALILVTQLAFTKFANVGAAARTETIRGDLRLVGDAGETRAMLRLVSGTPVLQLMDDDGRPRLTLGLRYDGSPFLDLSDAVGEARLRFHLDENDRPQIVLFDANGNPRSQMH